MGLTFTQKFYHIAEDVFILFYPDGRMCAIMEIPEDEDEKIKLQNTIGLSTGLKFEIVNLSDLADEGAKIKKQYNV